jgi:hypothetical protein
MKNAIALVGFFSVTVVVPVPPLLLDAARTLTADWGMLLSAVKSA